jgi:hypothetical protein
MAPPDCEPSKTQRSISCSNMLENLVCQERDYSQTETNTTKCFGEFPVQVSRRIASYSRLRIFC